MHPEPFLRGAVRQYERPDWRPLEKLLGSDELCAHFMWMEEVVLEDWTHLHVYKHRWTRAHLHLTEDARTFYWAGENTYGRVDPYVLISQVFDGWERVEPTDSERMALRRVLDQARDDHSARAEGDARSGRSPGHAER